MHSLCVIDGGDRECVLACFALVFVVARVSYPRTALMAQPFMYCMYVVDAQQWLQHLITTRALAHFARQHGHASRQRAAPHCCFSLQLWGVAGHWHPAATIVGG